jgi:hypothetical protein
VRSEVLRAVQAGMHEAAQQPILIKRTTSLADKAGFRWTKCSATPSAETSVTGSTGDSGAPEMPIKQAFLSIFFHFRMGQV